MSEKSVIITGATGMVGGCALRICLKNPDVSRVHLFRPGYIYPVTPRKEPNLMYSVSRFLYPLVRRIYPNIGISSEDLAAAMVHAGLYGTGESENPILENRDIQAMKGA